jgi:polyhydroxybutyrate depolymerase
MPSRSLDRVVTILCLFLSMGCGHRSAPTAPTPEAGPTTTSSACAGDPECQTLTSIQPGRAYLLHVPASFRPNASGLVIALHGSNESGATFRSRSLLNEKADQAGFAVAYPYALLSPGAGITEWNEFFTNSFGGNPPDDVGFLRELIVALQAQLRPDPRRIYVTGFSNGAFMTHRAGIQLSGVVAAIAVAEGSVVSSGSIQSVPVPLEPISVLMLHGDGDPTVPYCGGPAYASQEESFNYWRRANRCSTTDTAGALCDPQGITSVAEKDASGCARDAEVKFYKLLGGLHDWYTSPMSAPGSSPFNPTFDAKSGVTTNDIVWNFFASHPKQ